MALDGRLVGLGLGLCLAAVMGPPAARWARQALRASRSAGGGPRRCWGCNAWLQDSGLSILVGDHPAELCATCRPYVTEPGNLGQLIREAQELRSTHGTLTIKLADLSEALAREQNTRNQALQELDRYKRDRATSDAPGPVHTACYANHQAPLSNVRPAEGHQPSYNRPPTGPSAPPGYGMQYDPREASPSARTKMWVEQTGVASGSWGDVTSPEFPVTTGPLRGATSPLPVPRLVPWSRPDSDAAALADFQSPSAFHDLSTPRTPSLPRASPRPDSGAHPAPSKCNIDSGCGEMEVSDGLFLSDVEISVAVPTRAEDPSRLELLAGLSDRGSEHSRTSSRLSSAYSHPMQSLRQSRDVRAALADDIAFMETLINSHKKPPRPSASTSTPAR